MDKSFLSESTNASSQLNHNYGKRLKQFLKNVNFLEQQIFILSGDSFKENVAKLEIKIR
jgi:hypothetical protein